jgi:hypothetical protein
MGFWEIWAIFVVSWWTQRGEFVVKTWCFDGHKFALKNIPSFCTLFSACRTLKLRAHALEW